MNFRKRKTCAMLVAFSHNCNKWSCGFLVSTLNAFYFHSGAVLNKEIMDLCHVGGVPFQSLLNHSNGAVNHFLLCSRQCGGIVLQKHSNLNHIKDSYYCLHFTIVSYLLIVELGVELLRNGHECDAQVQPVGHNVEKLSASKIISYLFLNWAKLSMRKSRATSIPLGLL